MNIDSSGVRSFETTIGPAQSNIIDYKSEIQQDMKDLGNLEWRMLWCNNF